MTAQFFSGFINPTGATASSAAAGFPATNALIPGVSKPWKSTGGGAQWIQVDLGSAQTVTAVALHDMGGGGNVSTIQADTVNPPVTSYSTFSAGTDENGRRKGSALIGASVRYIRFNLTGSIPAYSVGCVLVFAASQVVGVDPLYGDTTIRQIDPQVRKDLPNGIVEAYSTGPALSELDLGFAPDPTADIEALRRAARLGPCWIDFGITSDRGRQWPVRHVENETDRQLQRFNREPVSIKLREIT